MDNKQFFSLEERTEKLYQETGFHPDNPNNVLDREHLRAMTLITEIRSRLVALDTLLHAQHNRRHPIPKTPMDLTPTQHLDPITRAEIDATP